jgi:hypothetical protein
MGRADRLFQAIETSMNRVKPGAAMLDIMEPIVRVYERELIERSYAEQDRQARSRIIT